jgi:hypothetical protein
MFNLNGDGVNRALGVQFWGEFRLSGNGRAFAVLDFATETSVIFVYTDFGDGERSFSLIEDTRDASAWLMRGPEDGASDPEAVFAAWSRFLAEPKSSEDVFPFTGDMKVVVKDGLLSEIEIGKLEAVVPVPPHIQEWMDLRASCKARLALLQKQLSKDRMNDAIKRDIEETEQTLRGIKWILAGDRQAPPFLEDGRIVCRWVPAKRRFDFEWP